MAAPQAEQPPKPPDQLKEYLAQLDRFDGFCDGLIEDGDREEDLDFFHDFFSICVARRIDDIARQLMSRSGDWPTIKEELAQRELRLDGSYQGYIDGCDGQKPTVKYKGGFTRVSYRDALALPNFIGKVDIEDNPHNCALIRSSFALVSASRSLLQAVNFTLKKPGAEIADVLRQLGRIKRQAQQTVAKIEAGLASRRILKKDPERLPEDWLKNVEASRKNAKLELLPPFDSVSVPKDLEHQPADIAEQCDRARKEIADLVAPLQEKYKKARVVTGSISAYDYSYLDDSDPPVRKKTDNNRALGMLLELKTKLPPALENLDQALATFLPDGENHGYQIDNIQISPNALVGNSASARGYVGVRIDWSMDFMLNEIAQYVAWKQTVLFKNETFDADRSLTRFIGPTFVDEFYFKPVVEKITDPADQAAAGNIRDQWLGRIKSGWTPLVDRIEKAKSYLIESRKANQEYSMDRVFRGLFSTEAATIDLVNNFLHDAENKLAKPETRAQITEDRFAQVDEAIGRIAGYYEDAFRQLNTIIEYKKMSDGGDSPEPEAPRKNANWQELERLTTETRLESKDAYMASLDGAIEALRGTEGILELPNQNIPTIVIPDLHAKREFLWHVLNEPFKVPGMPSPQEVPLIGRSIRELLQEGKINVVCLGDGMHSERKENWVADSPAAQAALMTNEMIRSLGMMKMVMDLKAAFPDNFHYIRGNHDDMAGRMGANLKYCTIDLPDSTMFRRAVISVFGKDVVDRYQAFEDAIPLVAVGNNFIAHHTVPDVVLTRDEIRRRDPKAIRAFMDTNNVKRSVPNDIIDANIKAMTDHHDSIVCSTIGHREVEPPALVRDQYRIKQMHKKRGEAYMIITPSRGSGDKGTFIPYETNPIVAPDPDATVRLPALGDTRPNLEPGEGAEGEYDEYYDIALQVVVEMGRASASMLQRHLKIGIDRAQRLLQQMERDGVVGPADGTGQREVLIVQRSDIGGRTANEKMPEDPYTRDDERNDRENIYDVIDQHPAFQRIYETQRATEEIPGYRRINNLFSVAYEVLPVSGKEQYTIIVPKIGVRFEDVKDFCYEDGAGWYEPLKKDWRVESFSRAAVRHSGDGILGGTSLAIVKLKEPSQAPREAEQPPEDPYAFGKSLEGLDISGAARKIFNHPDIRHFIETQDPYMVAAPFETVSDPSTHALTLKIKISSDQYSRFSAIVPLPRSEMPENLRKLFDINTEGPGKTVLRIRQLALYNDTKPRPQIIKGMLTTGTLPKPPARERLSGRREGDDEI